MIKNLELNQNWVNWFIGFVEGDGCFVVLSSGYIRFEIYQKEKAILLDILSVLGFGKIYKHKGNKCYTFVISDRQNLNKI